MSLTQRLSVVCLSLIFCLTLVGCSREPTEPSLPLVEYIDPGGAYVWAIPEGWTTSVKGSTLTLSDPAGTSPEGLQVKVFLEAVTADTPEAEAAAIKTVLQPFLTETLDDSYEVYNEGQTKVNRLPTMILDFAKPHGQTYLVGREVIVMAPSAALAFIGTGERDAWENFLPTFRKMLTKFELVGFTSPDYLP
jgi:hypothetical protein